jgi:hypothetical protein
MLIPIRSVILAITKGIGSLSLGGVILWQVAVHSGFQNGIAYVHVLTPNVEILVDDVEYHVETLWETPIVCELRPGRHTLRMTQNGRVLDEQEFTLGVGQEVVLPPWVAPTETQGTTESIVLVQGPRMLPLHGRKRQ